MWLGLHPTAHSARVVKCVDHVDEESIKHNKKLEHWNTENHSSVKNLYHREVKKK